MEINFIKMNLSKVKRNQVLLKNFSWVAAVEVFMLLAPLITYPYLTRVLGLDVYGYILTAQMLAGYASLIIDFGSNSVVAKHVSINRNNDAVLSEIVCSVFFVRSLLWLICLLFYSIIVVSVPIYRDKLILFLFTYGFTLNEVLFPRYFFQGIEKMQISSIINIGIKLFFILFIFVLVKSPEDYLFVPVLYTIGYGVAGVVSMVVIFGHMRLRFYIPPVKRMMVYVKDSSSIFATDIIKAVKDRFNYILLGYYDGMSSVVVYDLGVKLISLISKPIEVISQVLFPRFAQNRDIHRLNSLSWIVLGISCVTVLLVNVFLPWIVVFFLHDNIDLFPLRLFTIAPIFLSISSILSTNFFVAFGYNRYLLYSIIVTTTAYMLTLGFILVTGQMNSIYSFVAIALISYFVEFLYRLITKIRLTQTKD